MSEKTELSDQEIISRLAKWVVSKRMTAPAIIFMESHRPLTFVGSTAMVAASPFVAFFEPFLKSMMGPGFEHASYKRFAEMMEDRENLDLLVIEIERESQRTREAEKQEKLRRKQVKKEARATRRALKKARKAGQD